MKTKCLIIIQLGMGICLTAKKRVNENLDGTSTKTIMEHIFATIFSQDLTNHEDLP